jgi:hypothetical protein
LLADNEKFWGSINGPGTQANDGDAYNSKFVDGYNSLCPGFVDTSQVRSEYSGSGYHYGVKVNTHNGTALSLYVYDPSQYFAPGLPPNGTDLDTYDGEPCAPQNPQQLPRYRFNTTFTIWADPLGTPDYYDDDVQVAQQTYVGGDVTKHNRWFQVGGLDPTDTADGFFRVQVTTNELNGQGGVYGVGRNQYSLALGGARSPGNDETIFGMDRISIFNNIRAVQIGQQPEWYMARIPSERGGDAMSIRMFDPGDATCNTSVQVLRQDPSDPSQYIPVQFDLNWTGNLLTRLDTTTGCPTCNRQYNGQWITMGVRIPQYESNGNPYQTSWWKVRYNVAAGCRGTSTDRTVWEILMLGNPIRLIEPPH